MRHFTCPKGQVQLRRSVARHAITLDKMNYFVEGKNNQAATTEMRHSQSWNNANSGPPARLRFDLLVHLEPPSGAFYSLGACAGSARIRSFQAT
jgi:hypothetical protein